MKNKVFVKARAPQPWKSQGLNIQVNEDGKVGTSKDGEYEQGLRVVSFIHQENDEKQGKYKDYEIEEWKEVSGRWP